jgi:multidrug efflux pump subunit AcrA (membrane-fusion protein)
MKRFAKNHLIAVELRQGVGAELRARRVPFFLAAVAVCAWGLATLPARAGGFCVNCAQEVTTQPQLTTMNTNLAAIQALMAKEATLLTLVTTAQTQLTLLQTQLATPGAPGVSPAVVYTPATPLLPITDCVPTVSQLTKPAAAAVLAAACANYNVIVAEVNVAQTSFDTQMTAYAAALQALSVASVTISQTLNANLQVNVVNGKQANLIGRHMANLTLMSKRFEGVSRDLARVRGSFVFGTL